MAFIIQTSGDWMAVFRQAGTVGVICVFFGLIIWKVFIPMMRETVADARSERDRMSQQLDDQAKEFTEHIKTENDQFRTALRDVVDGIERRKTR